MPDTEFASKAELEKAHLLWTTVQESMAPQEWEGFLAKYGDPFLPLPSRKDRVDAFILQFGERFLGGKTPEELGAEISQKRIDIFVKEMEKTREDIITAREAASNRSKKYIDGFIKEARQEGAKITDTATLENEKTTPLSLERFDEVAKATLEQQKSPGEALSFFETGMVIAEAHPEKQIGEIVKAIRPVVELAPNYAAATATPEPPVSFANIAKTPLQKLLDGPADAFTSVFGAKEVAIKNILSDSFEKAVNGAGQNIVSQPWFQAMQTDANRLFGVKGERGGVSALTGVVSDVGGFVFRGAPDERMAAYLEMWYTHAAQHLPPPSFAQFQLSLLQKGPNAMDTAVQAGGWLQWAKGFFGGAKTVGISGGKAVAGGRLLASFGGWPGIALAAGTWLLGKAQNFIESLKNFKGNGEVPGDRILIIGIVTCLLLFSIDIGLFSFINLPSSESDTRDMALFTNLKAGGGDRYTGPVNYTGPKSSDVLQCLNYDTTLPFTKDQHDTMEATLKEYQQIGLYNCVLQCPANKINMHSYNTTSSSGYWGYAPGKGDLYFYLPTFRASSHARARLLAHELGHQMAYARPEILDAFKNGSTQYPRGYCGCLGTYHFGGKLSNGCYSGEVVDETFAEAAAMYLTGENLQSLCQPAYNFMSVVFNQCSAK